jgi:cell division protein FtsX
MPSLIRQHALVFLWSLKQWRKHPLHCTLITFAITISLFIPLTLQSYMQQTHNKTMPWEPTHTLSYFFKPSTPIKHLKKLSKQLQQLDHVTQVRTLSSHQATQNLKITLHQAQLKTALLNHTKLPPALFVSFDATNPKTNSHITTFVRKHSSQLTLVQHTHAWMQRMNQALKLVHLSINSIILMMLGLITITMYCATSNLLGHYIRFINLLNLLGASKYYIRRHFNYLSLQITLLAFFFASLASILTLHWLQPYLHIIDPNLPSLSIDPNTTLQGFVFCLSLGYLASYLATRQLNQRTKS